MFAYLVLLHDPSAHPLLCVEEPENQLYPDLLGSLAEEFAGYARRGGQVFVSTHSPDFLNEVPLDSIFWLSKRNGLTSVVRARDDERLRAWVEGGDKPGYLLTLSSAPVLMPEFTEQSWPKSCLHSKWRGLSQGRLVSIRGQFSKHQGAGDLERSDAGKIAE